MHLASQQVRAGGIESSSIPSMSPLQQRRLERQRRRQRARWISSLILVGGLAFVVSLFAGQEESGRVVQLALHWARDLLPSAIAAPTR